MSSPRWIRKGEYVWGQGDPEDVLNRPIRDILESSDYASDGSDFAGFAQKGAVGIAPSGAIEQWGQNVQTTTGLTFGYRGGLIAPYGVFSLASSGTVDLTDNATNYVERNASGTVVANTSGFTSTRTPMAKVQTVSGSITSVIDSRNVGLGTAPPRLSPRIHGTAVGDGTTDDGSAIAATEDAAGTSGIEHYPGTYLISTNRTFSKMHKFHPGAIIKPASGVTVTFTGDIEAGPWKIFDFSAGGAVRFTNNTNIRRFLAQWFGVVGDNVTDDQPALTAMVECIPDYSIVLFSHGMKMRLDDTWQISQRENLVFTSGMDPRQGSAGAPEFRYNGADGGYTIQLWASTYIKLSGFRFSGGVSGSGHTVATCIDIDGNDGHRGGDCVVEYCVIPNDGHRSDWIGVAISRTVISNQEYHWVSKNLISGYTDIDAPYGWRVLTTSGSAVVSGSYIGGGSGNFQTLVSASVSAGKTIAIRIANGGGPGVLFTSSIQSVDSTTQITLANPVPATLTNAWTWIGTSYGKGVSVVQSFNAKRIVAYDNTFQGCYIGLHCGGGSFQSIQNNFPWNEIAIWDGAASEPSSDVGSNMEGCRQYLVKTGQFPFAIRGLRGTTQMTGPNIGLFECGANGHLTIENASFDSIPETGSYIFSSIPNTGMALKNIRFEDVPRNRLFKYRHYESVVDYVGVYGVRDDTGVEYMPTYHGMANSMATGYGGGVPALRVWQLYRPQSDAGNLWGTKYGVASTAEINLADYDPITGGQLIPRPIPSRHEAPPVLNNPFPTGSSRLTQVWSVGHMATAFTGDVNYPVNSRIACYHARMPIFSSSADNSYNDAVGMIVTGPRFLQTGSVLQRASAIIIEPISASGIANARAIDQEGTEDFNYLRGYTHIAVHSSAPDDSKIEAGQMIGWMNESTNELTIRIRKSDGTYRTAVISTT